MERRDPEQRDPARSERQEQRETLIERQIREAMEDGRFDDLPHQGERLPIQDDSAAGDWALAFRMLRNAGVSPPWIAADKEVRALLETRERLFARARRAGPPSRGRLRAELEQLVADTNAAIERVDAEAPTRTAEPPGPTRGPGQRDARHRPARRRPGPGPDRRRSRAVRRPRWMRAAASACG